VALFSCLGWKWPPQAIMGWPRASMLKDKAMGWDRLEPPGSVEVWPQLGNGACWPSWPELSYRLPMQLGGFGWPFLFSPSRPRSPGGSNAGRCSCDAPG